jgi:beta-glucosidase
MHIFQDSSQPLEARIEDLLEHLTPLEKSTQLRHDSPAVERLGIPEYNWWNECLHGVGRNGKATVFPQAINLAATFNPGLVKTVFRTIAHEARAKYGQSVQAGLRGQYRGLTFWTPNVNIFRDPRWGRGQETYGECPYLMSVLGLAVVNGLQGDDPDFLLTAACAKHYAVHSGPEEKRHVFDARPTEQDFRETYLPAFKALVEGGVETVMGAYNRTYGEPCCGSELLLQKILREEWGFEGHVVSDCWAVRDFHTEHNVTGTPAESAALALKNGCDLNCGCVYEELPVAFEEGLITEEDLDRALRRLLRARFRLGMFDETPECLEKMATCTQVAGKENNELALEAARQSVTLLKNRNQILPLQPNGGNYYICGSFAANLQILLSNYYGLNDRLTTILEGVTEQIGHDTNLEYWPGFLGDREKPNKIDWGVGPAKDRDAVIAVVGIEPLMEGEEGEALLSDYAGDRRSVELPKPQKDYVLRLAEECDSPLILVVCGGSAVSLGQDLVEKTDAILWAGYPGQAGGTAVGEVLFGKHNPSGRLPFTVPTGDKQLPDFEDYRMDGRTYRFLHESPEFPFGFGLSYTRFTTHSITPASPNVQGGDDLTVTVHVSNDGAHPGHDVVQLYLERPDSTVRTPISQLVDFQRIHLEAGEKKSVELTVPASWMQVTHEDGSQHFEAGTLRLHAGGCSPGKRGQELGISPLATAEVTLTV